MTADFFTQPILDSPTRAEYYRVLASTSAVPDGDPTLFIDYSLQGPGGLRSQVAEIEAQHRTVVWRDFVYDHG